MRLSKATWINKVLHQLFSQSVRSCQHFKVINCKRNNHLTHTDIFHHPDLGYVNTFSGDLHVYLLKTSKLEKIIQILFSYVVLFGRMSWFFDIVMNDSSLYILAGYGKWCCKYSRRTCWRSLVLRLWPPRDRWSPWSQGLNRRLWHRLDCHWSAAPCLYLELLYARPAEEKTNKKTFLYHL